MGKYEKFCIYMTWISMVGGLITSIVSAVLHDHQPSYLLVFLLYAFCFLSWGMYTYTRIDTTKRK